MEITEAELRRLEFYIITKWTSPPLCQVQALIHEIRRLRGEVERLRNPTPQPNLMPQDVAAMEALKSIIENDLEE